MEPKALELFIMEDARCARSALMSMRFGTCARGLHDDALLVPRNQGVGPQPLGLGSPTPCQGNVN